MNTLRFPQSIIGWLNILIFWPLIPFLFAAAVAQMYQSGIIPWLAAYLVAANYIAFFVYAFDKIIAPAKWFPIRVPEAVLAWEIPFLGGGYGALLGVALGHKVSEKKTGFRRDFFLANLLFITFWLFLLWSGYTSLSQLNHMVENFSRAILDIATAFLDAFSELPNS